MSHPPFVGRFRGNLFQMAALLFAASFLIWTVTAGQHTAQDSNDKVFTQRDYNPKDPVKIVNIAAASNPVKLDEKFNGGPDWLRGTQIRLKNESDKEIVYIQLQFNFPETKSSGHEMSFRSQLGNMPGMPVLYSPLSLKPGEDFLFSFSQEEYQNLIDFVGYRTSISKLSRTDLKIGFVVFADSTAWGTGLRYKPNPNKRESWIPDPAQP